LIGVFRIYLFRPLLLCHFLGIITQHGCYNVTNMKIQIITLFPEMFPGVLNASMLWKAQDRKIVEFSFINLRDFGLGPRKQVDDTPYGGGDGMLLKPEPLVAAIEQAKQHDPEAVVVLPTPRGTLYKQSDAKQLAADQKGLIIICPRYEGYDERVTTWVDKQFCIGNYILTGGELPAMVIIDSVVRLLPGVLGGETSTDIESFQDDDVSVEFPQYTRPEEFRGMKVPEVLLNGNHGEIAKWRQENSR
jgi:tRNA (guanine37-N1)-methyltransferase